MSFLFRFHDIIGGIHVPVDDGVDKLNRKYTLLVFLFLALPIFTKQYIGDPIECFAPVYFAEHQSRYINSYCWTQSTYYMVPVGDPEDDGDQQEPPDRIMPDEVDYFIGLETVTHIGNEKLRRIRVSYYQWAPMILLVQGLCFYIPFLIWNSCANNAGVKLRRLLKKASDIASLPPGCQQREALLAEFVDQFHTLVTGEAGWCADLQCGLGGGGGNSGGVGAGIGNGSNLSGSSSESSAASRSGPLVDSGGRPARPSRNPDGGGGGDTGTSRRGRGDGGKHHQDGSGAGCCLVGIPIIGGLLSCCLKPCTSLALVGPSKYLCLLYLAVKTAYVLNVVLQFFLLGQFLGRGYLKHGLELINRLIVNGDWWASPRFPLSTLCQVRADMSGGLRSYTCQCVLPINVFNEKIFSVVWFYMAFLMPLNVLSLLFWIYRTFETNRLSYIRLCLWRTRLVELNQIHRTVRRLSQSYLGWDGVFLLRLIEHNHGSIMATLIMSRLWEFYANQMKLQEDANEVALATNAHQTLAQTSTANNHGGGGGHHHNHGGGGSGAQNHQHHSYQPHQHQPQPHQHLHGPPGAGPQHHHMPPGGAGRGGAHGHGGVHGHQHHPAPPQHALPPPLAAAPIGQHFGGAPQPGAGGGPQLQQQQHQQQFAGAAGPHAHHSGQISQPGHHPPLHAANSHAAVVAAARNHHPAPPFPPGTVGAGLLAQLQQQHQHQHPTGQQQQQQQPTPQQPASGNVAAAVAALAAAAAAATHSSTSQTPATGSGSSSSQPNSTQAAAAAAAAAISQTTSQPQTSTTNKQASTTANKSQQPGIHLHSLVSQQQQQQTQSAAVHQQAAAPLSGQPAALAAATAAQQPPSSVSTQHQHQHQLQTSSFMNAPPAAAGSAATGAQSASSSSAAAAAPVNPPLPPPPPAHVVAAVAAAACAANQQQQLSGQPLACDTTRSASKGTNQQQQQPAPVSRTKQQQQQQPMTDNETRMKNYL